MASSTSRTRLTQHFVKEAYEMGRIMQKGLFGGHYVRFMPFLDVGGWLYQTGAVLGRARSDRLEILAKMLCEPGREEGFREWLYDLARKRVAEYGRQPDSFFHLFMTTEFQKAGLSLSDPGGLKRAAGTKLSLEQAGTMSQLHFLEGVGLGSGFPELTERMWRQAYEPIKQDTLDAWAEARRYGVHIPIPEGSPPTLEEREQQVLLEVADYAAEYFPELIEPLGLGVG